MDGVEKVIAYIERCGGNRAKFARACGLSEVTLSRILSRKRKPTILQALAIRRVTMEAVEVGDWVEE